jgi:hypothetical protein
MTRGPRMGGGPMMAMHGGAKAKNFKSTLMRLVRFSSDYWLQLIFHFPACHRRNDLCDFLTASFRRYHFKNL